MSYVYPNQSAIFPILFHKKRESVLNVARTWICDPEERGEGDSERVLRVSPPDDFPRNFGLNRARAIS